MLSPLKPLLCRHDFYWSERHLSERCRRCGKRQVAEEVRSRGWQRLAAQPSRSAPPPDGGLLIDFEEPPAVVRSPKMMARPRARQLKAQAMERREALPSLLGRLANGSRLTREETIDAILAVIDDAHSVDPVLFGANLAGHFARLDEGRSAPELLNPERAV